MPISPEKTPNPFESMSDEALRQILREDFSQSSEGTYSQEELLQVMQALSDRCTPAKTPEEAYEIFRRDYLPEADSDEESKSRQARKWPLWRVGLVAAMAAIVILVGGTLTANALEIDLWGIIGKWTQETFHFGKIGEEPSQDPDEGINLAYSGLREALDAANVQVKLVPTWLPEGFEEKDIDSYETPFRRIYNSISWNGEHSISIHITEYLSGDPITIEQSESAVEVYTSNGIVFYIFDNNKTIQIGWINANFECCISGDIESSDIHKIIDSIQ